MMISVVTLGVRDLDRARRFYRELFGDTDTTDSSGVCYFELDGSWLALYPRGALASYCGVADDGQGFTAVTVSINLPRPEDVDALCAHMVEVGARTTVAPGPAAWGGRIAWLRDPDGHLLELVWNPKHRAALAR